MSLELITSTDWGALANQIIAIITSITTVIGAIVAAVQKIGKDKAQTELEETQAFFDPADNEAMTPTASTPDRSWKMSEETKAFILSNLSDAEKVSAINQINEAEANGYVDYKIVVSNGYYNISYGLITGGSMKTTEPITAPAASSGPSDTVEGTYMKKSVFSVMTAGEKDDTVIEYIKKQMQEKDAVGIYPYVITTDNWMYTITKPIEPYFSQYGNQYSASQLHK